MSIKKVLVCSVMSAVAFSVTNAIAGGATQETTVPVANTGYYVDGNLGYASQDYYDSQSWANNGGAFAGGVRHNNNNDVFGGFSAGVDAGYEVNRHVAIELGWFYLPSVNVMPSTVSAQYLTSWELYLAAKYRVPLPVVSKTNVFFKLGVGYRNASLPSNAIVAYGVNNDISNYVRPVFAAGLDYAFNQYWTGIFQYAYFMGAANSFPLIAKNAGSLGTVPANVFTLGLGYRFVG